MIGSSELGRGGAIYCFNGVERLCILLGGLVCVSNGTRVAGSIPTLQRHLVSVSGSPRVAAGHGCLALPERPVVLLVPLWALEYQSGPT